MQKEIGTYWLDVYYEVNYKIVNVWENAGSYIDITYYDVEYAKPVMTETSYRYSHEELNFDTPSTEDEYLLDSVQ
tara:strand:- start:497 stop:721 length:225 start_codon:yes stop_codon:yes gene_type:complete